MEREEGGLFLFGEGSIDLDGEQKAEAGNAWVVVKGGGVALGLDFMLLENDDHDGQRTLEKADLQGLILSPTLEGRAELARHRKETDIELRRKAQEAQLEAALGCSPDELRARRPAPEVEQGPRTPTYDELRTKAAEVGISLPPLRHRPPVNYQAVKAKAYEDMLTLERAHRDAA